MMTSQPSQRLTIITDLYRLLLDRLFTLSIYYLLFCIHIHAEVLLDSNRGVLVAMENARVENVLGDIIISDSDPLLLV